MKCCQKKNNLKDMNQMDSNKNKPKRTEERWKTGDSEANKTHYECNAHTTKNR